MLWEPLLLPLMQTFVVSWQKETDHMLIEQARQSISPKSGSAKEKREDRGNQITTTY